ncbi:MAG: hypothetical protein ACM3JF_00455 [Sphaerimonospora mesophila]
MAIDVGIIPTAIADRSPDNFDGGGSARDEIVRWDAHAGQYDRYQLAALAARLANGLDLTERAAIIGFVRARRESLLATLREQYYPDETAGTEQDQAEAKASNAHNDATFTETPVMPQYAILGLLYPNRKVGYHPEDGGDNGMFDYSDDQKAIAALAINTGQLPDFMLPSKSSTIEG